MLPSPGNRGQTPSSHFVAMLFAGALAAQQPFEWQRTRALGSRTEHAMAHDVARGALPLGGGCTFLLAGQILVVPAASSATGFCELALPIPLDLALRGSALHGEAFVADPAGPVPGLTTTAGRTLVIGGP